MNVRDGMARLVFFVVSVMRQTEEGLDEEEGDDDGAEDCVGTAAGFVQLDYGSASNSYTRGYWREERWNTYQIQNLRQMHSQPESHDQRTQAENLQYTMEKRTGNHTHEDRPNRKQEHDRNTHYNSMSLFVVGEGSKACSYDRRSRA